MGSRVARPLPDRHLRRSERLPANLVQARLDYFGARTYERIDRPRGEFLHTDWTGTGGAATSGSYQAQESAEKPPVGPVADDKMPRQRATGQPIARFSAFS